MLVRNGWVSNSSSSSFIVNKDLSDRGIKCWKIPRDWYSEFKNYANDYSENKTSLDVVKDYWLTEFIVDANDDIDNYIVGYFDDGDLGGSPRSEEWVCVSDEGREVWDGERGGVWVNKDLLRVCGPSVTPAEIAAKIEKQFGTEAKLGCYVDGDGRLIVFNKDFKGVDDASEECLDAADSSCK